jgi:hypothetical protein
MFKHLIVEVLGVGLAEFLDRHLGKILTLILGLYLTFFLNLGTRTLAEHVVRIAETPEARDFSEELRAATIEAVESVTALWPSSPRS